MRNAFNRQYAQRVVESVSVSDIGAGNEVKAKLPMGALVLAIVVLGTEAFNPDGDDAEATLTVGDGDTTFANAVDVTSTGSKTVNNVPKHYPQGGEVSVSLAQAGDTDATAGEAVVTIEYVIVGAGETVYG